MSFNYEVIHGLDFTDDEIQESLNSGGLLSLELEFTRRCNLRCVYCYSEAGAGSDGELTLEEIKGVIDEAIDLGAKKIILLGGGEPLLYEHISEVVRHIHKAGVEQTIFTNGYHLTENLARYFFEKDVSVVLKHNSFKEIVQDSLAGVEGAYRKIQEALANLFKAGYPKGKKQLAIQTVIVKQNLEEIPSMWTWARKMGIIPYFEVITMQGRAKRHQEIVVTPDEIERVFNNLKQIDKTEFGIEWMCHPTIASFTCQRHLYSCLVNSQGNVQPCTGVDLFVGNVRDEKLVDILGGSRVINDLRGIHANIEGKCSECDFNSKCYGCRGNAYQLTGNYLASDPACWIDTEKTKGT